MSMQFKKPAQQVISMLVSTSKQEKERFVFLCEETPTSHKVQMYSGPEVPGAHQEEVFYKDTEVGDFIDQEALGVKKLGQLDDFLGLHLQFADQAAQEGKILADQLMLCRAVFEMAAKGCSAQEAVARAKEVNELVIHLQTQLHQSVSDVIKTAGV